MINKNFRPNAAAVIRGSAQYPEIRGKVFFRQRQNGVLVTAEVYGLPRGGAEKCSGGIFAFHIHEGGDCSGNADDPFANVKGHYNPGSCPHPYHAGDLPPLMSNTGYAYMSVITDRFRVSEVIGRSVIIHSGYDDFTTQPSGNAGEKIACGVIEAS
ncbi:MAG TPA: superoxide dismutase family protein [Candidatus Monoglobus merdigallinarum]|uniref:Superoxide dismutase family protein n=1 Tax=Candidatus Monoglobus merdigallinarum TaxID=2838698 RepID=A0A9D1PQN0_9FIRM|nr:superoxide dismutase family protein [Candidatus Monoglobus merdigallinarum]